MSFCQEGKGEREEEKPERKPGCYFNIDII